MRRNLTLLLAVALLSALATGCSNHDENEWQRLVCEVYSVNDGFPLLSAYLYIGPDLEAGTADDVFPVDWVPVQFHARPYSSSLVIPEDDVSSWFHVTNYDLTWVPGPNCPAEITDFNIVGAPCDAQVPVGDFGMVHILVADRVMKEQPWFRDLYHTAPGSSFTAAAKLTFYGHETGNTQVVEVPAGFMTTFYGAVDPD